jgi:hypothetical protein
MWAKRLPIGALVGSGETGVRVDPLSHVRRFQYQAREFVAFFQAAV